MTTSNIKPISEIETNFNISKLKMESSELLNEWDISQSYHQFCFTHRDVLLSERDKVLDGCGSLFFEWADNTETDKFNESGNLNKKSNSKDEADFVIFNEKYKDSYFYFVYTSVVKKFNKVGRMRLMCLKPQTCYSWHYDVSNRLHIPISSNLKCQFIVDGHSYFLPDNGNSYLCNTRSYHTAFNANPNFLRLHLVFDILD